MNPDIPGEAGTSASIYIKQEKETIGKSGVRLGLRLTRLLPAI